MRDTTEKWTGRDRGGSDRGLTERLSLGHGVFYAVTSAAGLTAIDVLYVMTGGGGAACIPGEAIHNSRHQPLLW
jgi:hypothetical protein